MRASSPSTGPRWTLFEDPAFRAAVKATGKKRLIVADLHTEICRIFATVQALKDGYEVMYVTDAVSGRSQAAHSTAIDRMAHTGAIPTTALAVVTETFSDWAAPLAGPASEVIYWYFNQVGNHTDQVGLAQAEKKPQQLPREPLSQAIVSMSTRAPHRMKQQDPRRW